MTTDELMTLARRIHRARRAGYVSHPGVSVHLNRAANPLLGAGDYRAALPRDGGFLFAGHFGEEGFFTLPFAEGRAQADALIDQLLAIQRAFGAKRVSGPVAPSFADLNRGAAVTDDPDSLSDLCDAMPAAVHEALISRGFRVARRSVLYRLDRGAIDIPFWRGVADRAASRFGVRVVSAGEMGLRAASAAMAALSRDDEAMALSDRRMDETLLALGGRLSPDMTCLAMKGGQAVGYIMALEGRKTARLAAIQVRRDFRNRALTAVMGLRALTAARRSDMELGVVDEDNAASHMTVRRFGGRVSAIFNYYDLKLTDN